jgi:hypothetical protein
MSCDSITKELSSLGLWMKVWRVETVDERGASSIALEGDSATTSWQWLDHLQFDSLVGVS